jgi:hypothetical protein
MIDSLFFDSDCISAFLWVNEQNLLPLLYPGMVVIPKPVYAELAYPTTPHRCLSRKMSVNSQNNLCVALGINSR